jgi:nucleoside-diphosphate-sugar epimerase
MIRMTASFDFIVTGANGFIGKHLVAFLRANDFNVLPLTRLDFDLSNFEETQNFMKNVKSKYYFHLASTGVNKSKSHDFEVISNDLKILNNLMRTIPNGSEIILSGSMSEYGSTGFLNENMACYPKTSYGIAKFCCTSYALAYAKEFNHNVKIARLFGVYGEFEYKERLFPYVINGIRQNFLLDLSDGFQIRDFIYVHDACRALLDIALKGEVNTIYNVGSGIGLRIREVINNMVECFGNNETKKNITFGKVPRSPGDEDILVADMSKFKDKFGWVPEQRLLHINNYINLFNF